LDDSFQLSVFNLNNLANIFLTYNLQLTTYSFFVKSEFQKSRINNYYYY